MFDAIPKGEQMIPTKALTPHFFFSGYKYMFNDQLVTVWSAPNYCYRCGNVASILEFQDVDNRTPKMFDAVPDRYYPYIKVSAIFDHFYNFLAKLFNTNIFKTEKS